MNSRTYPADRNMMTIPAAGTHYFKYSIIVPSYNREEEIRELLESFRQLQFDAKRVELIIADDGSRDQTGVVVDQYRNNFPYPLHFYHQENQGPGAARNMGMARASGDFFIFVDSDCTVPPDFLENIDQQLQLQQADAFGGRDSFRQDFPDLLKAINYSMTSFLTTGGLRGREGKKLARFYPRSFNMGLSRTLFKRIGGFGSLRHGQDIEYSHRIIKSGARLIYIHDAVVFHKRRTSIRKFFRQVFNWGVARINLYTIDPGMLEFLHAAPALATILLFSGLILSWLIMPFWLVFQWVLAAGILSLFLSGIHASIIYRSPSQLVYVPLIMPIQILGYGCGFIIAFVYRIILGKPEFTGFRKKYYQ